MTMVSVAVSEIARVGPWALRALGYPAGVADRTAKLVAWTEALQGHCLEALRVDEMRLIRSKTSPTPKRIRESVASSVIDAFGRSLLEVGPVAIDLVTGAARLTGHGEVSVRGVSDTLTLTASCALAAGRGVALVAIHNAASDDAVSSDGAAGWALYVDGPSGIVGFFGRVEDAGDAVIDLLRPLTGTYNGDIERRIRRALERASVADGEGRTVDMFGILRGERCRASVAASAAENRERGSVSVVEISQVLARAHLHGIEVEARDIRHLYELETRSWAPTSERSRQQAGFQSSPS